MYLLWSGRRQRDVACRHAKDALFTRQNLQRFEVSSLSHMLTYFTGPISRIFVSVSSSAFVLAKSQTEPSFNCEQASPWSALQQLTFMTAVLTLTATERPPTGTRPTLVNGLTNEDVKVWTGADAEQALARRLPGERPDAGLDFTNNEIRHVT